MKKVTSAQIMRWLRIPGFYCDFIISIFFLQISMEPVQSVPYFVFSQIPIIPISKKIDPNIAKIVEAKEWFLL